MPTNMILGLALGAASGGSILTPSSVPNLAAAYDASDAGSVTLNVGDVASIADKSGNSRTAAQVTAGEQPAYDAATGINSKNVMAFTGANNDALSLASSLGLLRNKPGATYIGVVRIPTLGTAQRLFTCFSSTAALLFSVSVGTSGIIQASTRRVAADTVSTLNSTAVLTAATAAFVAVSVDYDTGTVFIQVDGTTRSQTAAWTVGAASEDVAHSAAPLIGRTTTNTLTGDLGEMAIYDRALSAAEIADLRNRYFKPKWALS